MNRSYEVEYSNLELRFDRRLIQNFIKELIEEGYSLYWNENEYQFIMSVRSGRNLIKLKFERNHDGFKLVGNYSFKDKKLVELMEHLIGYTKGHAVVKRFNERQILIDNIMYGEIIRTVEISGFEHKVLFDKGSAISVEEIKEAFASRRIEQRIPVHRLELDYELALLHELLQQDRCAEDDVERKAKIKASKHRLEQLRREMLLMEV